jgi:hypothetical protein
MCGLTFCACADLENDKLCLPSQHVTSGCEPLWGAGVALRMWEEAMRKAFRPYFLVRGLKRYFVEWRRSALHRRELRLLSDRECSDTDMSPMSNNKVGTSFWYLT